MFNRQVFFKAVYGLQGLIIDKRGDTCNISLSKQFHAEDLASSTTGDVQRMSFNLWYGGYRWLGHNRSVQHVRAKKAYGGVGFFIKECLFGDYEISEEFKVYDDMYGLI